jgi:hypothetical protein
VIKVDHTQGYQQDVVLARILKLQSV